LLGVGNSSVSLADLDADGDVEIIVAGGIFDHQGARIWQGPFGFANTAADLDGDDDLEVVTGGGAYHHDGSLYFADSGGVGPDGWIDRAIPHVADLDLDGEPEVMFVGARGITIVEHDGTVTTTNAAVALADRRPAAIHDLDGDSEPEIAVGALNSYSALEVDLTPIWTAPVDDTGHAGGTAFDFLGDGSAEGIYADHTTLFVFDEAGTPLFSAVRSSGTAFEYPVVADVDNDGSAEIVVVSNGLSVEGAISPPVQVLRDAEDRWISARRIWNQEDYHVTNVREDGTIPQVEPKNWLTLNTFRTQAQIQAGEVCDPEPAG